MERYTNGYTDGFSDGLTDKTSLPKRQVKHLVYMVGAFTTIMAALAYPQVTVVVAIGALLSGLSWWFYPLARAKFTKPIEVVKEKPVPANPTVHDQKTKNLNAPLSEEETKRLYSKPVNPQDAEETRLLTVIMTDPEKEEAS